MVEFEKDKTMKTKMYLDNYAVKGLNQQLVIVITHDKYTFSANNGI